MAEIRYRKLKQRPRNHLKTRLLKLPAIGLIAVMVLGAIIYLLPSPAKAQDDYTFGTENVTKGYSVSPTERNTENAVYNTLTEADQYADTNFTGSSENIVTGTGGGAAFPGALTSDDASRRNYIEANTGGGSATIQVLRPNADGTTVTLVEFPTTPATDWDKVDETTAGGDADTTYLEGVSNSQESQLQMSDASDPGGSPNIDVTMWHISRGESTSSCTVVWGLYIGSTKYQGGSTAMTSITYTNYSYEWTVDPSDAGEWTLTDVNALRIYLTVTDANPDTRTTQMGLIVEFNPTASYQLDAQITYSSVASTSQTTGFQVLAQGYRNGDTESVNLQAWNYTSSAWVTKATISAGSDTDYDFNLLGWAANCERSSGNVVLLRLVDVTGGDATQTTVYMDVLKVKRVEQGYALDVDMSATTVAQYGNVTLRIKGYTSNEQFNVNVWNYTSAAYDTGKLAITSLSNSWQTTIDLCDVHHRSTTTCKIQFTDNTPSTADTTADILYLDVAWITRYHTDPVPSQYGGSPPIVTEGEQIVFFLNYSDYDNEAPSANYPKVHIDSTDYTMSANNSYVQYTVGKSYYYTKSDLAGGVHNYYFIIDDASSSEVTTSSAQVTVNFKPTLSSDTVLPATGNSGQTFNFTVTFTDQDGDMPSYIKANIDTTDYNMVEDFPGDTNTVDGKAYHYEKALGGGNHPYYFRTADVYSGNVQTTGKNIYVNNLPALSNYGRTPADPVYVTTQLNFTVTFTDSDNDLPSSIKWRENLGSVQNLSMVQLDPYDLTTTDGKGYCVFGFTLGHGAHSYDYYASDSGGFITGGSNEITIQNRAPTITNKFIDDHEWKNIYWEYDYANTEDDGDTVTWAYSHNSSFLSINSGSGLVYGTTSNAVGWYSVTVWCNDSYGGSDSDSFTLYVDNRAPVITSGPGAHIDNWRNTFWDYDFDYSDADSDTPDWEISGYAWLSITPSGYVSGTTPDAPGLYSFTVYCNDTWDSDTYVFELHITNRAPVITNGPAAHVDEWRNTYWQYDFDATDSDTDTISWGRSGASWLTIDSNGLLSGTTTDTPGEYSITVYANDSYSGQDTYIFTLHISNRAPTITDKCSATPSAYRNAAWSFDFNGTDADSDTISWARSGASWLTIDSGTGVLSGTTTDAPGDYVFTVYANDSYSGSDNYQFTLSILNRVPVITSAGNTTQQSGTYMAYLVTATDSDGDGLTLGFSSNASWLSVSGFWINGTATGIGWYACTIWVNDSYGGSDSDYWEVTVWSAENQPPSFTSAPKDSVGHPVDYYYDCNASDPELDPLTFDMTSTHPNLVIDPSTGIVTGYIGTAGTWDVNISVTDGELTVWQNFSLVASNTVPSFTSSPIETVAHPENYYYDANATDSDGDTLSYGLESDCAPLGIISGTGVVSGLVTTYGTWYVHISVSDGYSIIWQNFSLSSPNYVPYFTSTPIENWPNNTGYLYDVDAVDPESEPLYYDLFGDIVALGFCTINHTTGQITGLPHLIGDFSANVSVTDGTTTVWQNWSLHIYTNTPVFDTSPITEWQNGTSYLYEIHVHDPENEPLTWGLQGNCTSFLALDDTTGYIRNLTGNVPSMGWWYVNVSCFDGFTTVWQNFTLISLNTAPSITSSPVLTGQPGVNYFYDLGATDINGDSLYYDIGETNAPFLVIDHVSGEISGVPVLVGDYFVNATVWDGLALSYQNFTIVVSIPATPPVIPPTDNPSPEDSSAQASFRYTVVGNKIVLEDTSFGVIDRRQWSFGDGTGSQDAKVTHTYLEPGNYTITLTVWSGGYSSVASISVSIGSADEWGVEKGEASWKVSTPVGAFEWNATISLMVGLVMLIVSLGGQKFPVLKSKVIRGLGVVLMAIGVVFYAI